jgi:hypothetical protein
MPKFLSNIEINATPTAQNHAARIKDTQKYYKVVKAAQAKDAVITGGAYSNDGTLTYGNVASLNTIDGVTLAVGDAVLIWQQVGNDYKFHNGIYTVVSLADDGDTNFVLKSIPGFTTAEDTVAGVKVYVEDGDTNAGKTFRYISPLNTDLIDNATNSSLKGQVTFEIDNEDAVLTGTVLEHIEDYVGDGSTNTFNVAMNSDKWGYPLNMNYTVDIYDGDTGEPVYVDYRKWFNNGPSQQTVTLTFAENIPTGQKYKVITRKVQA